MRGIPWSKYNLNKTDEFQETVDKTKTDIFAMIESGIYNNHTANMPLNYDKQLNNNIIEETENKHITPNGAGTTIWANNKVTL